MSTGAKVLLYDDAKARTFEPFALTRPIGSLVTGIFSIGARWGFTGTESEGFLTAPHLADFDEDSPALPEALAMGTIVANSRFAPEIGTKLLPDADTWTNGGRIVAVRVNKDTAAALFSGGTLTLDAFASKSAKSQELPGWWHDEVWDYLRHLPEIMTADITAIARRGDTPDIQLPAEKRPPNVMLLGKHPVLVRKTTTIEPFVVFDASAGPIFIDDGAVVHSFTRINGPCYIGRNAIIMGGDVSGCSIGTVSKIRGEISGSIVLGYSNKGHDGFVGNSYFGRWVNLGAGTVTSNLKNTYGEVSLWTPAGVRPTGMQFLGTLFGDHVKTGIGTTLTTGTVLGAGANVFGSAMPPKAVAPFSWGEGEPYDLYQIEKFLATAATVMGRRKISLSERAKRQLSASFEKRWSVK